MADTLTEEQLREIEERDWFIDARLLEKQVRLTVNERDALCRSLRQAWGEIERLNHLIADTSVSVAFWQAEALLEHFCSEHAKNTRQAGHYCTVCAKPLAMSVPQGTRPPKYQDLVTENAALCEQLAQVEKERDWFKTQCKNLQEEVRSEAAAVIEARKDNNHEHEH